MPLRSIVAIALDGTNLEAALASDADAILLNVADERVPPGEARQRALDAIYKAAPTGKRVFVTVNHPRTRLLRDDLDALVCKPLSGVFLSYSNEPQDIRDLAVLLREFELSRDIEPGSVSAYPVIATARGLLRAHDIAAAVPRDDGLVFDAEAYARDIGARHEEVGHRLAYARGAVVAAARAQNGLPLISPMPVDPRDAAQQGFAAAVVRSVSDVVVANLAFQPYAHRIERARGQLAAFDAARAEGAWVARHHGDLIDAHAAKKARQLVDG